MVDSRVRPLVALERDTIEEMCAAIAGGAPLGSVAPIDGGLVNTVLRVTTASGIAYALRVSSADEPDAVELTRRLGETVPVPDVLVTGNVRGTPYTIHRWIPGITFNECRRAHGSSTLASLAEPIGRTIGAVASAASLVAGLQLPRLTASTAIDTALEQLHSDLTRARVDTSTRHAFAQTLVARRAAIEATDKLVGLVHGDFSGRNLIVRDDLDQSWRVSGLLDWETAAIGSPLWDIGSLFRYARRYDAEFRKAFERAYHTTGPTLPNGWWHLARLLDATRLVGLLAASRELPDVFDDCRAILADLATAASSS